MTKKKLVLIIMDGWGIGDGSKADAIANANTLLLTVFIRIISKR